MSANLENSSMTTGLEKVIFIPIPKKGNAKECSNYHTTALISHASKVMLKILQAKLQQYVNWEVSDVQAGFRKGRRTKDQIASICWITEKAREVQENIYFYFTDYTEAFDCVDHNCEEFFKRWEYQTTSPASVRTGHGTADWFKSGKGVREGHIRSPCLFNLYAEYIMQNARLYES